MLTNVKNYLGANPLRSWIVQLILLLAAGAVVFWVTPWRANDTLILPYVALALSLPTVWLLRRFSSEERAKHPILPSQETAVGILSLLALLCSATALGVSTFGSQFGLSATPGQATFLLLLFAFSMLVAMTLGFVSRSNKVGFWGLTLSCVWLVLIVSAAILTPLRS